MKTQHIKWITTTSLAAALTTGTAFAYESSSKNNSKTIITDEEWYDPTDWFDGDSVDYETVDSSEMANRDNDADWEYWDDNSWEEDYENAAKSDRSTQTRTGTGYVWNDSQNKWEKSKSGNASDTDRSDTSKDASSYGAVASNQEKSFSYGTESSQTIRHQEGSMASNDQSQSKAGQAKQDRNTWQSRNGSSSNPNTQSELEKDELSGELLAFRKMKLQGQNESTASDYVVAKMELETGKQLVVSLGEKQALDQLKLKKGDSVKLTGVRGQVDGEPVFIAKQLKAKGKSVDVNRAIPIQSRDAFSANRSSASSDSQQARSSYDGNRSSASTDPQKFRESYDAVSSTASTDSQQTRYGDDDMQRSASDPFKSQDRSNDLRSDTSSQQARILGTVESFKAKSQSDKPSTKSYGSESEDTLQTATLKLENGESHTLALEGKAFQELDQLKLSEGDEIMIQGKREQHQGEQVVIVEQLWVNGSRSTELSSL